MNCIAVFGCLVASLAALRADPAPSTSDPANWQAAEGTPTEQLHGIIDASTRFEIAGDIPSAITTTSAALQRLGRDHYRRRDLERRLIDLHIQSGTLDALIADTSKATSVTSTAVGSWKLLAEIFRLQGKHVQRRDALRAVYKLSPADERVAMELAEIESSLGDQTAAAAIVESSLKRRPNDIDWTLLLATIKVREQQMNSAETLLNALLSTDPDDKFLRTRTASFYESHRMTEALRRLVLAEDPEQKHTGFKTAAMRGSQDPELLFALADSMMTGSGENSPTAAEVAKLAESVNQAGDPDRAMDLIQHANRATPANPDVLRVLLTLCAQSGNLKLAAAAAEEAIAINPALAPTFDYQLFQLLGSATQPDSREIETPDSLVAGLMNSMKPGGYFGGEIKRREAVLQSDWEKSKSPVAAQRLALWQSWRGEPEAAAATLLLALRESPENIPLLELRLELALKSGDRITALELIEQLQALQPELAANWKSKTAAILLDQEQFDSAIDLYQSLADESPSDSEAWMNLASAQQRAGNYFGALDSWIMAFGLANESGKTQIRTPILAVIERLRLWQKGVEFLSDYAAGQSDEATAIAAYEQAIAFAIQHDQVSYLREKWVSAEPEIGRSTALLLAQAELANATNDHQEALRLLAIASGQATDKALVWMRLLDAAGSADDHDRALMAAAGMIEEDDSAKSWLQLAHAQEASGAKPDAAATWDVIKHRFNRDPEALEAAAAFFDRNGDFVQAGAVRLAAAYIDGASPATIFHGIEIALESGDRALAITLCDRLLAQTTPLTGTNLSLPGASEHDPSSERQSFTIAMQAMGGLNDPESVAALRKTSESPNTESVDAIRLKTIQTRARLSQAGAEREAWIAWSKNSSSPAEAVWAWYAMNQHAEALHIIESSNAGELPVESEQSFAWIALKGDQLDRLRAWVDQSPEDRRRRSEFVFMALSRLLLTTSPETDRLGVLFPLTVETISERWQAAWMLAAHGHFQIAVDLASPALDITPAKLIATGSQTLAAWNLVLRDTPGASEALSHVTTSDGSSLDQPAFHAWRMRWLLESDEGRAAMEEDADRSDDALFKAGTKALAAALQNDADATRQAAGNLMSLWTQLAPTIVLEGSLDNTIRSSVGMALSANLPMLAFELTRATGQLDRTQTSLQDASANPANQDTQLLSLLAKLQCSPPAQVAYHLAESSPPTLDAPTLTSLYRQLDASGHPAASAVVLSEILRAHAADFSSLNEIAFAARRKGDFQMEVAILEAILAAMPESKHFPTFADASLRLSDLYIQRLRPADALPVIDRARTLAPSDPRFASMADRALQNLGKNEARIAIWRLQADHFPESAAMWIQALHDNGRTDELAALTNRWMEEGKPFSTQTLVSLIGAFGFEHPERANQWLKQLTDRGAWTAVAAAAQSLTGTKSETNTLRILRDGMDQSSTPEDQKACANALINLTAGKLDRGIAEEISLHAEELVRTTPSYREAGHQVDVSIAKSNPHLRDWFEDRLNQRRQSGADPQLAWIALVEMYLEDGDGDRAGSLTTSIASAADWPTDQLAILADRLARAGKHRASAHLYEILYEEEPTQQNAAFAAATQLWHSGERYRSRKLIEPFVSMRWFDPVLHMYLAEYFNETGDVAQASAYFSEIVARDPSVSKPGAWAALAKIHAERNQLETAKQFLDAAYSNPALTNVQPLVDFITGDSTSRLDIEQTLQQLRPAVRTKLDIAVIRELLDRNQPMSITPWLSPRLATSADGLRLLDQLVSRADVAELLEPFWIEASTELPRSRAFSDAHATFILAQAERAAAVVSAGTDPIQLYQSAHETAPWRFDTSGAYAQKLIEKDRMREASAVLQKMLGAAPTQADRHKAQDLLARLKHSDSLISEASGI